MILSAAPSSFGLTPTWPANGRRPHSNEVFLLNQVSNQRASGFTATTQQGAKKCELFDLCKKLVPYEDAWHWQKQIAMEKRAMVERNEEFPDTLIVLQHQPVYTLGAGSSVGYLNFDMKDAPFDIYRTERGGEVTYHGPGQLVMYPIINLRNHRMDLHWYLRALEEVVIRVLSSTFSIEASRVKGLTGVWVGDEKVAAIGVKVSRWITYHGLALNVTTDLTPFNWIVPCGIRNRKVGSIKELLLQKKTSVNGSGDEQEFSDSHLIDITHKSLMREFADVFQLNICHETVSSLESLKKTN